MSTPEYEQSHRYEEPDKRYGSRALVLTLLLTSTMNFIYFALPHTYELPEYYVSSLILLFISIIVALPGIIKNNGRREAIWGIVLSVLLSPLLILGLLNIAIEIMI